MVDVSPFFVIIVVCPIRAIVRSVQCIGQNVNELLVFLIGNGIVVRHQAWYFLLEWKRNEIPEFLDRMTQFRHLLCSNRWANCQQTHRMQQVPQLICTQLELSASSESDWKLN